MYIYEEFCKKYKKLMDVAQKELDNTVRWLTVSEHCEYRFQSAFDNSLNIDRLKKDFDVEIKVKQTKSQIFKNSSNALKNNYIFVLLKKKFENGELSFNYHLKRDETKDNRLELITIDLKGINDLHISLSNTTLEVFLKDYPFVFQKHKGENRDFEFGIRGKDIEDYKRIIQYFEKRDADLKDDERRFIKALKFMTQLYTSEVFYINKEFTCDVFLSKLYDKKIETVYNKYPTIKHELELRELSGDENFNFINSHIELLSILTPVKKKPKIEPK